MIIVTRMHSGRMCTALFGPFCFVVVGLLPIQRYFSVPSLPTPYPYLSPTYLPPTYLLPTYPLLPLYPLLTSYLPTPIYPLPTYPLPPTYLPCEQTNTCENTTFPQLHSSAVIILDILHLTWHQVLIFLDFWNILK